MSTTNTPNTDTDNAKETNMTAPVTDTAQSGDNAFVEKLAKRKPETRRPRKTADTFQSVPEPEYSGRVGRVSVNLPIELADTLRRRTRTAGVQQKFQVIRALEMYFENEGEPIVADR